jgi:methanogenic corrinoid protein MtbC1
MKISKVAKLNEEDLRKAVMDTGNYFSNYDKHVNALKIAMIDYDEELFNSVFDKCILQFGIEETLVKIVGVFLGQIGMLWLADSINITNEHFVSNLVKQKLFSISDQLVTPKSKADDPGYILYLPEEELHELSLLYIYYFLKKKGSRVIYLGQSVPIHSLVEICAKTGIHSFVTICTSNPVQPEVNTYFNRFKEAFEGMPVTLYCSGTQLSAVDPSEYVDDSIVIYPHVEELKKSIA